MAALVSVATFVTGVLAAAMVVLAPFLCATIFGNAFSGSASMLRILAPGALGIVALKQLGGALIAQSKPVLESLAIGIAFAGMVALDLVLIPAHGGIGASVASTIAYTLGGLAVMAIFARTLEVPLRRLLPTRDEPLLLWRAVRGTAAKTHAAGPPEPPLAGETGSG